VNAVSLKSFLDKIQGELRKKEEVKEEFQADMRKATRLSKQAILFTHQKKFEEAQRLLEDANGLFVKLRKVSRTHPDLVYSGLVNAAFEEYAEAHVLLELIKESRFVGPKALRIPTIAYVLGLADVIGELRRTALDSLRDGTVEVAEDYLQMMEHIYVELMAMNEAYMLVPGLRRKCDVARRIIETTRGDVTVEARRSSLERSIKGLEKILGRKRRADKM